MSVLVKICGLKTPEALDVALEAGADMVGFVFFP
ncbi:MAG: N-(5'-phosphoribosyl)anthranilate isomerase, partial [Xanthobacteraceae bacterium]